MLDETQAQQPQVFLDEMADHPPVINDGKLVLVEVEESDVKYGRESGDPYIRLAVRVVEDPEDEGAPMFDNLMLPNARKKNADGSWAESDMAYKKRTDRRCFRLKQASVAFGLPGNVRMTFVQLAEAFRSRRAWARARLETDNRGNEVSRPDGYFKETEKPAE